MSEGRIALQTISAGSRVYSASVRRVPKISETVVARLKAQFPFHPLGPDRRVLIQIRFVAVVAHIASLVQLRPHRQPHT
jgi:hypothetical protein